MTRDSINDPAAFIKETRELLGITQAEMARAMKVSPQTISYWERGERIPQDLALEWCIAARNAVLAARKQDKETDWGKVLVAGGLGFMLGGIFGAFLAGLVTASQEDKEEH